MFRKLIIIAGATATLAAASLAAPTAASAAGGWHGHHGHGHGHHRWHRGWRGHVGFYAPAYYGYGCYVVKKRVFTPYGPRVRRVTVCN